MRGSFVYLSILSASLFFAGCSASPHARVIQTSEPLLVPTAAVYQKNRPLPALATNILPASDADYIFPRGEKTVYGAYSLGDVSAYTLYTVDAHRISDTDGDLGYQYRWIVQQGFAEPPPP